MNTTLNTNARRAVDKTITLLCIDDEADNLKLLASIFSDEYQIIACKSAEQGYQQAMKHMPDLILLDVVMPKESGFELIEKIKTNKALRHIPVIFITGSQHEEDEEKGLTLGACDYIQKPFNNRIVKVRVNTHLEIVRQRKLLEQYANIDALTEIPNRRKWDEEAHNVWQQAITNQSSVAIGIIDIDHFKLFNDCYGHLEGDIVLRLVANTLKRTLYNYSGRIFRCGGEEFYFYIPFHQQTNNSAVLDECLQSIHALEIPHENTDTSPFLSISIGAIKTTPHITLNLTDAIQAADDLLYQVKNSTRNAVQYKILDQR